MWMGSKVLQERYGPFGGPLASKVWRMTCTGTSPLSLFASSDLHRRVGDAQALLKRDKRIREYVRNTETSNPAGFEHNAA